MNGTIDRLASAWLLHLIDENEIDPFSSFRGERLAYLFADLAFSICRDYNYGLLRCATSSVTRNCTDDGNVPRALSDENGENSGGNFRPFRRHIFRVTTLQQLLSPSEKGESSDM